MLLYNNDPSFKLSAGRRFKIALDYNDTRQRNETAFAASTKIISTTTSIWPRHVFNSCLQLTKKYYKQVGKIRSHDCLCIML